MNNLLLIGIALLVGIVGGRWVKRLGSPAVVGYILIGVLLGPSILNLFTPRVTQGMDVLTSLALGFIGFGIGRELKIGIFKRLGAKIVCITLCEALGASILVFLSIYLIIPYHGECACRFDIWCLGFGYGPCCNSGRAS